MSIPAQYFRDDPVLVRTRLKPRPPAVLPDDESLRPLATAFNRIGGLLAALSRRAAIAPEAALAVWRVESGPLPFIRGRPVLRFEVHKYFDHWGRHNEDRFDGHFQFGGRAGVEGKPWTAQRYRLDRSGPWQSFHGNQASEYTVFRFAARLGGTEAACLSASFGGPQILGSNHALLGYPDAASLFRAFRASERWQVCGFFDFCRSHGLFEALRDRNWEDFARVYNGPGQAEAYARLIAAAYAGACELRIASSRFLP